MEKGYNIFESLKLVFTNLNFPRLTTGLIGALFSSMSPGMIVMSAAKDGQLTDIFGFSQFSFLPALLQCLCPFTTGHRSLLPSVFPGRF